MNQFGDDYSKYYDLLYRDKNYNSEVEYIDEIIRAYSDNAKNILDIGCGTGRHAELLCEKKYTIHGIDLSKEMLRIAEKRAKGKENKLSFSHSNVQSLKIDKEYDVIISLFHVASYQNSDEHLVNYFKVAKQHLKKGGIFIFDFWYGPAVLTDLPTVRMKKLENDEIEMTRFTTPTIHIEKNVVDVSYDIILKDKVSGHFSERSELHSMRYFFDTELENICKKVGLSIERKSRWLSDSSPSFDSWNVVWLVRK